MNRESAKKQSALKKKMRSWFVPMQKSYSALEADYKWLELNENGSINEKTPAFAEVFSRWGAVVEEVRTAFARKNDATVYIPNLKLHEN